MGLITVPFTLIGMLTFGLPIYFYLEEKQIDSYINVAVIPSILFAVLMAVIFDVHRQKAYLTLLIFIACCFVTASTFWYLTRKLSLSRLPDRDRLS